MKLKLISALVASAFAGIATTASAGVIQASYKNYASEVFGTDAVVLTAPTINYALALPLSGTVGNPNSFSISWTLTSGGEFVAAPAPGVIALTDPANLHPTNPTTVTLSTDKKTLTATFSVTSNYTTNSQIVLGSGGAVTITKVGTILGAPALTNGCGNDVASVNVAVKLQNAAGVEFDSNFSLAPLSNTTPIVQASVALSVTAKDSATFAALTDVPPGPGKEKGKVDVLIPSLGQFFTANADVTGASTAVLNIGSINIKDRSVLFDLDGTNPYSSKGLLFGTNPATGVGVVEANSLKVDVSGTFLTGTDGGFFASVAPDCTSVLDTGTIAADGKSATVTLSAASVASLAGASGPAPVYLCYVVSTLKVIPTSQFAVTGGSLGKFATALEAPNPVCPAPVYNLVSNGVRVDVRNYVPGVAKTASGWYSVVRVINTDDVLTVSPVIQALLADGTLGASAALNGVTSVDGKSGAFKPREVRYYTSDTIDAVLNAAATAAKPSFGANDVGGNARLRITAPSSSIRVQNYVFNPANGNFIEASAAQGDEGPDYIRQADRDQK